MNLPAFAVITIRERETAFGDDIRALEGLGRDRPELAWPLTISMLALAGLPGTTGFIGKLFLIEAAVDGGYTWLGVAIAIGTMVSLAYYLRIVAAVWMRPGERAAGGEMPAMAGGSPEADDDNARTPTPAGAPTRCLAILVPTALAAAATIVFGIVPSPLVDWASNAGQALAPFIG